MIQQAMNAVNLLTGTAPKIDFPLLPIVTGNTANISAKADAATRSRHVTVASTTYKRNACMTGECVACPYARDNGSC